MQKKNSGLGRGLGALLSPNPLTTEDQGLPPGNDSVDVAHALTESENSHPDASEGGAPHLDASDSRSRSSAKSREKEKEPYDDHLRNVQERFPTQAAFTEAGQSGQAGQAGSATRPTYAHESETLAAQWARVRKIPLGLLRPMKDQPRQSFHDETLEELAASIRTYGILQPIIASDSGDGTFTIVAGERRYRAASLAGLHEAPVIVRAPGEHTNLELALIENIQREELNPFDEARALQRLVQEHNYTQDALAARIGKDRATVANMLRLLSLPEEILRDLKDKRISAGHAKALCALEGKKAQLKVRDVVIAKKLSVRQTEELVKGLKKGKAEPKVLRDNLAPDMRHLCEELKSSLQMKVRISGASDKGKIEIEYFSLDDLERLSKILLGDPFSSARLPSG